MVAYQVSRRGGGNDDDIEWRLLFNDITRTAKRGGRMVKKGFFSELLKPGRVKGERVFVEDQEGGRKSADSKRELLRRENRARVIREVLERRTQDARRMD